MVSFHIKVLKITNKYIEIIKYFYNSIDVALDTLSTSNYIDSEDSYAPPELFSDSSSTTNSDSNNSRSLTVKL